MLHSKGEYVLMKVKLKFNGEEFELESRNPSDILAEVEKIKADIGAVAEIEAMKTSGELEIEEEDE